MKTHYRCGHERIPENTYEGVGTAKRCKKCHLARVKARQAGVKNGDVTVTKGLRFNYEGFAAACRYAMRVRGVGVVRLALRVAVGRVRMRDVLRCYNTEGRMAKPSLELVMRLSRALSVDIWPFFG